MHNVGQGGQAGVFWRMLRKVQHLKRRQTFDAVHATTWRVALPAMVVVPRLPLVVTVHGREVFVVPGPLKPLMRAAMRRAAHIPTVSQPILDLFEEKLGRPLPQAFANWNGISFETESAQKPERPDTPIEIFCMCRMVARKNVAGAIRAVAALVREGHDGLRFRIAGGGPDLEALHRVVAEEDIASHVHLLGRVPDEEVVPLYRAAHIFLHPQIATRAGQDMEGFGLTIADGMAFGSVPVAGASGGPLDFIETGTTGYLVDGEVQQEIVDALRRLITDPTHRQKLSEAARSFARQDLTWDAHAKNILDRLSG